MKASVLDRDLAISRVPGLTLGVGLAVLLLLPNISGSAWAQIAAGEAKDTTPQFEGVQPGDLIRLKIWREPEMSGDVVIDADGVAILPRLGPIRVGGWAPDSLRRFLVSGFTKYLKEPAIEVTVLPRVTILGAVRNPGVHNVDPTLTIADALALAGGTAPDGKQDNVELRRRGDRVPVKLNLGARLSDTQVRSGDQLFVPQRSWISRNPGIILGIASVSSSIIWLFVR